MFTISTLLMRQVTTATTFNIDITFFISTLQLFPTSGINLIYFTAKMLACVESLAVSLTAFDVALIVSPLSPYLIYISKKEIGKGWIGIVISVANFLFIKFFFDYPKKIFAFYANLFGPEYSSAFHSKTISFIVDYTPYFINFIFIISSLYLFYKKLHKLLPHLRRSRDGNSLEFISGILNENIKNASQRNIYKSKKSKRRKRR